jgi:8-oxo-(d)GTP phosphatase
MRRIEAAGGVLWRPGHQRLGVEVALVHRRGKDGWSLPKGTLLRDEHPLLGALREVREETGHRARLGPALGAVHYTKGGVPKRVRYWSLAASTGAFARSREIDDLVWLPPDAALRLVRARDRPVIGRFWRTGADQARPLLLVRPGTLVPRTAWAGAAEDRPLDARGRAQASAIVDLLRAFDVRRLLTADVRCCNETLKPFEEACGVPTETVLPMEGKKRFPTALGRISALAEHGVPVAVCAKQRDLTRLSREITRANRHRLDTPRDLRPGGVIAFHVQATRPSQGMPERLPLTG